MRTGWALNPSSAAQGRFKTEVLRRLREAYPNARFVCLGDDKYADGDVYNGTVERHGVPAPCKLWFIRCLNGVKRGRFITAA